MNSNLPDWIKATPNHPRENAIFDAHDAWKQAKKQQGEAHYRSCRRPVQTTKFHACNYKSGTWYPGLTKGASHFCSQYKYSDNCLGKLMA